MPPDVYEIKLKAKSNGTLDYEGHSKVYKSDFVIWSLRNNSRIDSFKIVKKSGFDIFIISPHKNGDIWTAEISRTAPDDSSYSYAIWYWINHDTTTHKTDPIISIKPDNSLTNFFNLTILLPIIASLVVGFFGGWGFSAFKINRGTGKSSASN